MGGNDPHQDTVLEDGVTYTLQEALDKLWSELPKTQQCFRGGMMVVPVAIPPENDRYSDAPCVVFFGMLSQLRALGQFDHVFQMETDVRPIRPDWLVALFEETSWNIGCKFYWQRGSLSHCDTHRGKLIERFDLHINGNS